MKSYVNHPDGGKKALEMLEEMKNQYNNGNIGAKPDSKAFSVAIEACSKNGLTTEAKRIIQEINDSEKSRVMFNSIITGFKSEGPDVTEKTLPDHCHTRHSRWTSP